MECETQRERAARFRELHAGPAVLPLVNVWDPWSARTAAATGAVALGTTSFGVAAAAGMPDGERVPWPHVRAVVAGIVDAVDVPVSVDIEFGGDDPARTVADVVTLGGVGVNIEDVDPARRGRLVPVEQQVERLRAARAAGGPDLYVNARCDAFFGAEWPEAVDPEAEVLRRAAAYLDAGADGIFRPGLLDLEALARLTAAIPAPVNVMVGHGAPSTEELGAAGVRRTSQGGEPFVAVTGAYAGLVGDYVAHQGGPSIEQLMAGVTVLKDVVQ
jgi:2-methylisocitrate lyase-like PEP mutase family enzyme